MPTEPAVKYVTARTPGMKRAIITIFCPCFSKRPSTLARFSGVMMRAKKPPCLRPTFEPSLRPKWKISVSPARMPAKPTAIITGRLAAPLCARKPPRMSEMSSGSGMPSPQARRTRKTVA